MSTLPLHKPATYEDLFDLPPNRVGQIVHGMLYSHPRPAPKHLYANTVLRSNLGMRFDKGTGGPGGWWIFREPEWHIGGDVLVPSLAGWQRERMSALPEAWFDLAPDWVCETLSPSTARLDRIEKMPIYAANGVPHLWLIDPDLRTLEAYENQHGRWTLIASHADQDQIRVPPFDAVALDLGGLWA